MIPLERTMSGVFHDTRTPPASVEPGSKPLHLVPSRMSMEERREFSKTHEPEWVLKGLGKRSNSPLAQLLISACKGFVLAFVGKSAWTLLFSVLLSSRSRPTFKMALKDTLQFSVFFSAYVGLLNGVNSFAAQWRKKDDRWNAVFAGIVSSFALLLDPDVERRRIISIYVLVRGVSVLVRELAREGTLPVIPQFESILFGVVNVPIIYSFLLEPKLMDQGYYKWILGMGDVTHEGLQTTLREGFIDRSLPFCTCQPHYHTGSCFGYCTMDWVKGLLRASKIYAPVHILPLLLFRFAKLKANPAGALMDTAKALLLSSMFLTTYQFNVKVSNCVLRNARLRDDGYNACFGGLITGFACLFETPSRVSELMLYCVPKAMEIVWNFSVKYADVKPVPYFELVFFMAGNAVLVSALKEDLKSTYFNALAFGVSGEFKSKKED